MTRNSGLCRQRHACSHGLSDLEKGEHFSADVGDFLTLLKVAVMDNDPKGGGYRNTAVRLKFSVSLQISREGQNV